MGSIAAAITTTAATGASTAMPARSGGKAAPQPQLVRAAHEFEGMMMQQLLKPMTQSDALTGDDGQGSGLNAGSGALSEFASEALGQAISAGGGFGIANLIIRQLSHSGNQHGTGKVTTNLHGNTLMRALK